MSDTLHTPSAEQRAIYDWFQQGHGHLIVRAGAGTGKSYTIRRGIDYAPEDRILVLAFGRKIMEEMKSRIDNPRAEVKTFHGAGFSCVLRYWERIRVERKRGDRARWLTEQVCGATVPDAIKRIVTDLHTKARDMAPTATEPGSLIGIAEEFDCVPDEEWDADGYGLAYVEAKALDALALAGSHRPEATGIDFADMIFLPIRNRWLRKSYDLVIADECQDLTLAQLTIAQGICKGRLVMVGDSNQAIFRFRGADSRSLDRLKTELDAQELGLRTTYRCGSRIVKLAQRLVPDYFAAEGAHEGSIRTLPDVASAVTEAEPGDYILSRKNAPLAGVALACIRQQKRVTINGRESFGAPLIALVKKLTTGRAKSSIPEFLSKLAHWADREVARAEKADREDRIEGIRDKADTLVVLAEGVVSVSELTSRVESLFSDAESAGERIICSSIHRAKGLEADRVYVLVDTLYPKMPCGDCNHFHGFSGTCRCGCRHSKPSPLRQQEERNLEYVATTRCRHTLVLVGEKAGLFRYGSREIAQEVANVAKA